MYESEKQLNDLLYDFKIDVRNTDIHAKLSGVEVEKAEPYTRFLEVAEKAREEAKNCTPGVTLLDIKVLAYQRGKITNLYEALGLRTTAKEVLLDADMIINTVANLFEESCSCSKKEQ